MDLDDEVIGDVLQRPRRLGIRLAVDDFGTGYSSLLICSACRWIFSRPIAVSWRRWGRIQSMRYPGAIVKLAHKLGLEIIAEGVEEAMQEQVVAASWCGAAARVAPR